jgi:hypothetical protein
LADLGGDALPVRFGSVDELGEGPFSAGSTPNFVPPL